MTPKLERTLAACRRHAQRLARAVERTPPGLDAGSFEQPSEELLDLLDQFAYRYARLQDTIGSTLLRDTLVEAFGEPVEDEPFLDVLARAERVGLIESEQWWREQRALRNALVHGYPATAAERAQTMAQAAVAARSLLALFDRIEAALSRRA
jgi:hypothetical protein